jgi:hypothetical protein
MAGQDFQVAAKNWTHHCAPNETQNRQNPETAGFAGHIDDEFNFLTIKQFAFRVSKNDLTEISASRRQVNLHKITKLQKWPDLVGRASSRAGRLFAQAAREDARPTGLAN